MKQRVIELTDFGVAENMRPIEADIPSPGRPRRKIPDQDDGRTRPVH